jgi:ubiquinol-cytochrome c reductase cytochrome c subunit
MKKLLLPALVIGCAVVAGFASVAGAGTVHSARPAARLAQGGPASINPQKELPASQSFTGESFNYPSEKLPSSYIAPGRVLFDENCASCHGINADGATGLAPPLLGVGAATVDFWVSTGRMPLEQSAIQPNVHPDRFTPKQTKEIVAYVASLAPGQGPGVPVVDTKAGNLAQGFDLFALNCAGCHVITGVGDALANSTFAPALSLANPRIIGDAVRSGPGNMPIFSTAQLSPSQLNSLARYVVYLTKHPDDAGGAGLGHVGPVAEGFVALFFGVGLLVLVAYWIGDRTPDPRAHEESTESDEGSAGEKELVHA